MDEDEAPKPFDPDYQLGELPHPPAPSYPPRTPDGWL